MRTLRDSARPVLLLLAAAALLAGPVFSRQKPADWKGRIEKEGEIVVVKNPRKPVFGADAVSLTEELAIGGESGGNYVFASISSIAAGPDGAIFVLDQKDRTVKAFGPDGKFLRTIGKAGEGPGEFSLPMAVHWTARDELVVVDARRRLSFFQADGRPLRDLSAASVQFMDARPDSAGNFYIYLIIYEEGNPRYELRKFDPALKDLFGIESSPTADTARDGFDPFFAVLRWVILPGDRVACGYAVKNEFRIYDPAGKLSRRILMESDPVPVAKEDVKERTEGLPPEYKSNLKVPKYYPAFRYLVADDEGRIFVLCWERPPGRKGFYFDVLDPEGRYIARAVLPVVQPLIRKGRLYAAEEDAEGNPVLKRYKITWKI